MLNGKFYIGKHQTLDPYDDYVGSGKLISLAIETYGREHFVKEVLEIYTTEREMNLAEKILVVLDKEVSYNLCPGGHGGFGFLNDGSEKHRERTRKAAIKSNTPEKGRKAWEKVAAKYGGRIPAPPPPNWTGKKHSIETKAEISRIASLRTGAKNSSFGSMWITDDKSSKKIKKTDQIPDGWVKGRVM